MTKQESKPHVLYFITAGDGFIKVGITSNLKKRLETLQSANHRPLTVILSMGYDTKLDARKAEDKVLREMKHRSPVAGEWFRFTEANQKVLIPLIQTMMTEEVIGRLFDNKVFENLNQSGILKPMSKAVERVEHNPDGAACYRSSSRRGSVNTLG